MEATQGDRMIGKLTRTPQSGREGGGVCVGVEMGSVEFCYMAVYVGDVCERASGRLCVKNCCVGIV